VQRFSPGIVDGTGAAQAR